LQDSWGRELWKYRLAWTWSWAHSWELFLAPSEVLRWSCAYVVPPSEVGGIVGVIGASGTLGSVIVGSGGAGALLLVAIGVLTGVLTGTLTWTLGTRTWTETLIWTGTWTGTGAVGTLGGATVSAVLCHGVSFRLYFFFFSWGHLKCDLEWLRHGVCAGTWTRFRGCLQTIWVCDDTSKNVCQLEQSLSLAIR
jgi:hypothetical protein